MMKIAVALYENMLAEHFGRTEKFAIFTCADPASGQVSACVSKDCSAAPHDEAGGHGEGNHGPHAMLMDALEGCHAVISGSMGHRIAADLLGAGIEPVVAAERGTPEELVRKFIRGELQRGEIHRCCHGA